MIVTLSAASCHSLKSLHLSEEQFNSGLVLENLVCFGQDERMYTTRRSCGVKQHVAADYGTLVATTTMVEFLVNHHQLLVCLH